MATQIGLRHVTTYLCAKGASDAIEFYKKAFGAEELYRISNADGRVGHAEIVIGDTTLYLSDEWAEMKVLSPETLGGNSVSMVVDVDDVDAAWGRAIGAGAKVERPISDGAVRTRRLARRSVRAPLEHPDAEPGLQAGGHAVVTARASGAATARDLEGGDAAARARRSAWRCRRRRRASSAGTRRRRSACATRSSRCCRTRTTA